MGDGIDYSADSLEVMAAAQSEMTPQELRAWEKDMTVSIAEMAGIFGVSARAVKNYLTGQQAIPVAMQIACIAMRGDQTILHARFRPRVAGRPKKGAAERLSYDELKNCQVWRARRIKLIFYLVHWFLSLTTLSNDHAFRQAVLA